MKKCKRSEVPREYRKDYLKIVETIIGRFALVLLTIGFGLLLFYIR